MIHKKRVGVRLLSFPNIKNESPVPYSTGKSRVLLAGSPSTRVPRVRTGIEVPRVDCEKLSSDRLGESSTSIRERVQAARERQRVRFEGSDIVCNSDMRVAEVRRFCKLDEAGDRLVRAAISQLNLSARGYHRVLKLARTL